MGPEVVLGVVAITALTVLGLAVIYVGGKLRATRSKVEITSEAPPKN